jgi:hypothetical protein
MKKLLIAAIALLLLAGCAVNSTFVYKPAAPVAGGPKLPVKVAVLPFKDGTEDFTKRGSIIDMDGRLTYNLAKAGISGEITALTPDLWSKAFADDMATSGTFKTARFVYTPAELADDDIEGTLEKAYAAGDWKRPNEFALGLRALRRADNRLVWEKKFAKVWKTSMDTNDGCGIGIQCMVDRQHADINRAMQKIFAEARADLVTTLAALSGSRAGEDGLPPAASPTPPAPESPEEVIKRILGNQ